MPQEKRRTIAGLGGKAAHAMGRAHQWTKEEASRVGRKGGQHPKKKGQQKQLLHKGLPKRLLTSSSAKRIRSNAYSAMEQVYFTPHEVAKQLRVNYRTVRRWISTGILPVETIREGRRNRHRIRKAPIETLETPSPGFA